MQETNVASVALEEAAGQTATDVAPDPDNLYDFTAVARCWALAESEQRQLLGNIEMDTFERWRLGDLEGLDGAVCHRLALVFEIFQLLQDAYRDPVAADGWVRKPNAGLHGAQPLAMMLESDEGLEAVRDYLADGVANRRTV